MNHDGMRELQDRYGGSKVADAIEEHRKHFEFTDEDREFIEIYRSSLLQRVGMMQSIAQ